MTHDEQDTALLLRLEAGAVITEVRQGQVDDVLTRVFTKRARQRAQRARIWSAITVVALVVAGTALVGTQFGHQEPPFATSVEQWPLRGELAGDTALLSRAEKVWRQSHAQYAPVGAVRPLFAQQSPRMGADTVVVVLSGRTISGRSVVAFVTSAATEDTPSSEYLFVRAVAFPKPGARAVGFVAATPSKVDVRTDWDSLAFALAAPDTSGVQIHSSMVNGTHGNRAAEAFWSRFPRGAGAWNSAIDTDDGPPEWVAAGTDDPVTSFFSLQKTLAMPTTDRLPMTGDMIVTPNSLYGVIVDANGRIGTSPADWTAYGTVRVASSNIPGTVADGPENSLLFTPTGTGEPKVGDQVVFSPTANTDVVVNVGELAKIGGQWRVHRFLEPNHVPDELMSVSPGSAPAK